VSVLDCDLRAWQGLAEPGDDDQDCAYSRDDHWRRIDSMPGFEWGSDRGLRVVQPRALPSSLMIIHLMFVTDASQLSGLA